MTTADIDKTINQILDADDQGSDIYDIDEDINTTIDDVGSGPVDSGEEVAKTATSDPVNAKSSASAVSDSKKEVLVPPGEENDVTKPMLSSGSTHVTNNNVTGHIRTHQSKSTSWKERGTESVTVSVPRVTTDDNGRLAYYSHTAAAAAATIVGSGGGTVAGVDGRAGDVDRTSTDTVTGTPYDGYSVARDYRYVDPYNAFQDARWNQYRDLSWSRPTNAAGYGSSSSSYTTHSLAVSSSSMYGNRREREGTGRSAAASSYYDASGGDRRSSGRGSYAKTMPVSDKTFTKKMTERERHLKESTKTTSSQHSASHSRDREEDHRVHNRVSPRAPRSRSRSRSPIRTTTTTTADRHKEAAVYNTYKPDGFTLSDRSDHKLDDHHLSLADILDRIKFVTQHTSTLKCLLSPSHLLKTIDDLNSADTRNGDGSSGAGVGEPVRGDTATRELEDVLRSPTSSLSYVHATSEVRTPVTLSFLISTLRAVFQPVLIKDYECSKWAVRPCSALAWRMLARTSVQDTIYRLGDRCVSISRHLSTTAKGVAYQRQYGISVRDSRDHKEDGKDKDSASDKHLSWRCYRTHLCAEEFAGIDDKAVDTALEMMRCQYEKMLTTASAMERMDVIQSSPLKVLSLSSVFMNPARQAVSFEGLSMALDDETRAIRAAWANDRQRYSPRSITDLDKRVGELIGNLFQLYAALKNAMLHTCDKTCSNINTMAASSQWSSLMSMTSPSLMSSSVPLLTDCNDAGGNGGMDHGSSIGFPTALSGPGHNGHHTFQVRLRKQPHTSMSGIIDITGASDDVESTCLDSPTTFTITTKGVSYGKKKRPWITTDTAIGVVDLHDDDRYDIGMIRRGGAKFGRRHGRHMVVYDESKSDFDGQPSIIISATPKEAEEINKGDEGSAASAEVSVLEAAATKDKTAATNSDMM